MAVRKGDRTQGKLQLIDQMRVLLRYTHERVKDQKTFPKSERWIMAKSIWDACADAHKYIVRANGIRVENREDAEQRLLLEKMGIGCLDELASLIDTAHALGQISDDRAGFWTGLVSDAQITAKGWLKSNRRAYSEFLKTE